MLLFIMFICIICAICIPIIPAAMPMPAAAPMPGGADGGMGPAQARWGKRDMARPATRQGKQQSMRRQLPRRHASSRGDVHSQLTHVAHLHSRHLLELAVSVLHHMRGGALGVLLILLPLLLHALRLMLLVLLRVVGYERLALVAHILQQILHQRRLLCIASTLSCCALYSSLPHPHPPLPVVFIHALACERVRARVRLSVRRAQARSCFTEQQHTDPSRSRVIVCAQGAMLDGRGGGGGGRTAS